MSFYIFLVHLHSILRWFLLAFIVMAIILSFSKKNGAPGRGFSSLAAGLWSMAIAHIQLIIGLVLYFISSKVIFDASTMKSPVLRFYTVEHILVMLIAIVLITIGYVKAKRAAEPGKRNRTLLIYFIIALLLILSRIPWPFLGYGGGWI